MKIDIQKVKISVTIPPESTETVRNAIFEAGAGIIGDYSHCSIVSKCIGTFKPSKNANPYIGEKNKVDFVEEEKLEFICNINIVSKVIEALRNTHPYEEPAINIVPLIDEKSFE